MIEKIYNSSEIAELTEAIKLLYGVDVTGCRITETAYIFSCSDKGTDITIPFSSLGKEGVHEA